MGDEDPFERNVFINCPFDARYLPLLQPLLFTVVSLGFTPKIALDRSDSAELRLDKISWLIQQSRFSIHDLSRIQAARKGKFSRMNMPFEFGIDYGCRLYGRGKLKSKACLILSKRQFEHMRAISDVAGIDAKHHNDHPPELVRQVRNWFVETVGVSGVPSASSLWYRFTDFMTDFYEKRVAEGFSPDDLNSMPVREFVNFILSWTKAGNA